MPAVCLSKRRIPVEAESNTLRVARGRLVGATDSPLGTARRARRVRRTTQPRLLQMRHDLQPLGLDRNKPVGPALADLRPVCEAETDGLIRASGRGGSPSGRSWGGNLRMGALREPSPLVRQTSPAVFERMQERGRYSEKVAA